MRICYYLMHVMFFYLGTWELIMKTHMSDSVRPPMTAPTSNVHNFHIRSPFEVHEYLMERFSRPLSNGSSHASKFLLYGPQSSKEVATPPVWAKLGLVMHGPKRKVLTPLFMGVLLFT